MNKKHKVPGTDQWITEEQAMDVLLKARQSYAFEGVPRLVPTFKAGDPLVVSIESHFGNSDDQIKYYQFRTAICKINNAIRKLNGDWEAKSYDPGFILAINNFDGDWGYEESMDFFHFSIFEPIELDECAEEIIRTYRQELETIKHYKFNK